VYQALDQQWAYHRERQEALALKTPSGPPNSVQLLYISAQQLAEQLTLREQTYFQTIEMSEYYCKAWDEGGARAPNLIKLITRFADMSYWVATSILTAHDLDGKPRCRLEFPQPCHASQLMLYLRPARPTALRPSRALCTP